MSLSNALSTFKISGPINFGTLNGSTMIGNNMGSYVGKSYIPRTGSASWTTGGQTATWTVPYGINSIEALIIGGGGNSGGTDGGGPGAGGGGAIWGIIPNVKPKQVFYIYVAGAGGQSALRFNNSSGLGAYGNGGGSCGNRHGAGGGWGVWCR